MSVRALRLVLAVLALAAAGTGARAAEPLRPEVAYRYDVTADAGAVTVHWHIRDGYYLYRKRMSFASRTPEVTLGEAQMPAGGPHEDEFFGKQEIYRGEVDVRIPIAQRTGNQLALEIRSQGCADIGLCYPPQVWLAAVGLPPATAAPTATAAPAGPSLFGPTRPAPGAPLPVAEAFRPAARLAGGAIEFHWTIAPGYYLYRDSLRAESATPGTTLGALERPPGVPKEDEHFGKTAVYYDEAVVTAPLGGAAAGPLQVTVHYQGCKEGSICYPPQQVVLAVAAGATAAGTGPAGAARPAANGGARPVVSEQDAFAGRIASGSLAVALLLSFVAGIGLSLLPCCWPMIPILSGIIVGDGREITTGRSFALSVTYVLGMAVVYAAAGALAAAAGQHVQAAMQTPWVIGGVAALFVAMALSMFGLFELALPAPLVNRLNAVSGRQQAGTFVGAAVMGALSALVVSACVAPPLVGVLTFIAQTGNVARGALALFAMAIGMGVPLLVIGASGGRLLPKAGPWMTRVKGGFGFVMLGLAVWMLDRILPGPVTLALWSLVLAMAAVFLGAFDTLDATAGPARRLAKGFGLVGALWAAAMLAGALAGNQDPLQPLAGIGGRSGGARAEELRFEAVRTVAELDRALARGQPALLDFYADWCTSCKEMERYTFTDPDVHRALAGAVLLRADVTANNDDDRALLARFGIFGPPSIVFFGADGREAAGYRVVGYMPAAEFAPHARGAFGAAPAGG